MSTVPQAVRSTDAEQAAGLRRARRRASGLLAAVAAGFLASFALPDSAATGFVRAALEAGLVGGLADWFAVVALFRHPLGIPIPHTAVIPRSKDGLGANLATFVRENFLGRDQVRERLADPVHVERLGRWLADPAHADRVAAQVAAGAAAVLDAVDRDRVVDRVVGGIRRRLRDVPVSRLAGESLERAIVARRHDALVSAAIDGLLDTIGRNRLALRRRLGEQSPGWVPHAVDDLVFERAEQVVRTFLRQVADDASHELRQALDEQLLVVTGRMQHDAQVRDRVDEAVQEALTDDLLRRWVGTWWDDLERRVHAAAAPGADDAALRRMTAETLVELGGRLQSGGPTHDRVVEVLASVAPQVATIGQQEVAGLVETTIERWDAEDTSRRLELWMGRDLQFVRINGTVVGALVGLLLHALGVALG